MALIVAGSDLGAIGQEKLCQLLVSSYCRHVQRRQVVRTFGTHVHPLFDELARLGNIKREEKHVLIVFSLVATAWILRGAIKIEALDMVHDSTIAIAGAILLFLIPSNLKERRFLLDWRTAVKIPWDVIILFGGGFALAAGFSQSGLTEWIAGRLSILEGANIVVVTGLVALLVIFLTEITSNTATASLSLPIMAAGS